MYLLYLDDSGTMSNPKEDYLVLGGICVFERQVYYLNEALRALAETIDSANLDRIEFHASEIFSGRSEPWNKYKDKQERIEIIKNVLKILQASHAKNLAFACAIHKSSYPGTDLMEKAFEEICNRFDLLLRKFYGRDDNPQRGLIILDETSYETSLQELAKTFNTVGTRWGVTQNIVDVPLFVDSRASRLIQLADHIAYAVFRRYNAGDTNYLDLIVDRFDEEDGVLHGLVHCQTINPTCMCPACLSRRSNS